MNNHNVELALGLGDYAYTTGTTAVNSWWNNLMTPLHGKFKGALGNHDTGDQAAYASSFGQAGWYFSFDYQNVHYVVMNSETTYTSGSAQYNFVKNDLAAAAASSTIDWIVVAYHRPMYSSPTTHPGESGIRDAYHSIFDQYGVDVVLEGHNHNYQRTYPLEYNSASPSQPTVTTNEKSTYTDPDGEIYIQVGTGGQSPYGLNSQASFTAVQFTNTYGYLDLNLINNGLTMKGTFYSNDGTTKDAFTITKTDSGGSPPPPTNTAPVASAGPDASVTEGLTTNLDGSGSSDPDGDTLKYGWTQTSGPTVALAGSITASPSFTAPQVTADTVLQFQLIVNDGSLSSGPDSVKITVKDSASPPPPPPPDDTSKLGVFYYPWMGGKDGGSDAYRHWRDAHTSVPGKWNSYYLPDMKPSTFDPSTELYDAKDPTIVKKQLGWMNKTGIDFVISSWWGQGHYTDAALSNIFTNVMPAADNPYPGIKFTIYYEKAGFPSDYNLSETQLVDDINYIKTKYGNSPYFLKMNGKPVIFVYNTPSLSEAQKWSKVRDQTGVYLVLKVFSGYQNYASLADSWHQYGPTTRFESQGAYSAFISPGWKPVPERGDSKVLAREDWTAWDSAASQLYNSKVKWKLIETWNEWGEGTGIEPAQLVDHDDSATSFKAVAPSYGEKYLDIVAKYFNPNSSGSGGGSGGSGGSGSSGYHYSPYFAATGRNYFDETDRPSLHLKKFSVSAWFKTSTDSAYASFIVNKGGMGSELKDKNLNYGIWLTKTEELAGGYEGSDSSNYFAISSKKFNDGKWHYAVVTYDGSTLKLYADGQLVASNESTADPESSDTKPVRIGANSLSGKMKGYFTGSIDEVRIWNRALSDNDVAAAYSSGSFDTSGQVVFLPFN
jgi:hypothetical protein